MASINNSGTTNSIYGALGLKNKGIGGLASGLDTDTLVTALVSGTTSKIAKQGQQKQLLNWKVTAYRSAATQLRAFQSKHFDRTAKGNTNMLSSGFWHTFKATSSSSKVTATATANATVGSITIDKVQQLATAETVTSSAKLSTELTLDGLSNNTPMGADAFTGKTLKLDVNGAVKTIKLDDLNEFIKNGKLDFEYYDEHGNTVDGSDPSVIKGSKFADKLQELVDRKVGTKNVYDEGATNPRIEHIVEVGLTADGKTVKLDSDTSKIIIANTPKFVNNVRDDDSLDLLGVAEGKSNRVDLTTKLGDIDAFKNLQGDVFTFSINGAEISVNKNNTLSELMSKIKSSDAGADLTYSSYTDEFTLTAKSTGAGENLVVKDVYGDLMSTLFGVKSAGGVGSNYLTVAGNTTSQDVGTLFNTIKNSASGSEAMKTLGSSLKYMAFEMTVDGVTKTVRVDTSAIKAADLQNGTFTQADVYNAINKGIKNAFTGTSVQLGAEYDLYDTDGNRVTGAPNPNGVINHNGTLINTSGYEVDARGNQIYLLEDGSDTKKLAYNRTDDSWYFVNSDGTAGTALTYRPSSGSDEAYWYYDDGGTEVRVDVDEAEANQVARSQWTGKTNIYGNGSAVTLKEGGIMPLLGFAENTSNVATGATALGALAKSQATLSNPDGALTGGTLTINNIDLGDDSITYTRETTLQQLVDQINSKLGDQVKAELSEDGKLSINGLNGSIDISDSGNLLEKLFGITNKDESGNLHYVTKPQDNNTENGYETRHKAGKNAEVVIDGKVVPYASNTFTIDGVNITVKEVSERGDAPITIGVASDVDDVVTRIKDWMDDYNALIYSLNSMINEGKNSDYSPLTDEQRSQLSEDQITKWETEAKKGILRNDNTLKSILAELRQSLYEKVDAAGISLFDIGITTKAYGYSDINEAGQLCFDENITGGGEAKLRAMLESDPDKVRLLFTDSTNGLAVKMNDIIGRAANESSSNRGSLVRLAGTERLTGDNTSTLGSKISAIDKYIAALKIRLESEYTRQWKKFSALEVAVQKMSTQSSWFQTS